MEVKDLELSVVIPLLDEEDNIYILWNKLCESLRKLNCAYEIIFINDGSIDASLKILKDIQKKDQSVKIISFKESFGQTAALSAGFKRAEGNLVVSLDCDLQNDPEDISKLLEKNREGYDLVCGWRKKRKDPFFAKIVPSLVANKIISCVLDIKIHDIGCTLKTYKKDVVKNINLYKGMHRFIPFLAKQAGFTFKEVEVNHYPRIHNKSKYGIKRVIQVISDLLVLKFPSMLSESRIDFIGKIELFLIFVNLILGLLIFILAISPEVSVKSIFILAFCNVFFINLSIMFIFIKLFFKNKIKVVYKVGYDIKNMIK